MISVVIPAYNAERTLAACVDGLLAQTAPAATYEIIIADDGSTDRTRAIADTYAARSVSGTGPAVRVFSQPNCGAGAARNMGAAHAQGDVLLFIDADSIPDGRWVEAMAAPFADPRLVGASGEKKTRQRKLWARFIQLEYDFKYDLIAAHSSIDFVDSSTAGYRREVFVANGGFDRTLGEAEDVELSFRLAERGYPMVLVRDAIAYHTHPESLAAYLVRKFQYARWRALVYARYPRKVTSDQRTPRAQKVQSLLAFALLPMALAASVWNVLARGVVLLAALFVISTLPFAARCWRRDRRVALVVAPALLLAAFATGAGAGLGFVLNTTARIKPSDRDRSRL